MAQKSRAEKLKSLKMPKKPMAEEEAELDLELEGLGSDLEIEEGAVDELPEEAEDIEVSELDTYSDEELMEEMKKRGLLPDDSEEAEEEPEDEELDEMDI